MTAIPRLPLAERIAFRRLYDAACLFGSLAARLEDHADRREKALKPPAFPQANNAARKTIDDLRNRAKAARADQAIALAEIDAISKQRSAAA